MELNEVIQNRRSIREYSGKIVTNDILMEILDAARYVPKAGNIQNFYFVVVKSKKKREEIADACVKQTWMKNAPIHIVVCNKVKDLEIVYSKKGELFAIQTSSAAVQNILLKATDLGLGSCWIGALNPVKIQKTLKLPRDIRVDAVITIGYPKKIPKTSKKIALDRITFFEEWGNIKA